MTIQYDDPQLQAWVDAVRNSGVKNSMNKFTGDGVKIVYDVNFAGGYLYKADIRAYKVSPTSVRADVEIVAVDDNRVTLAAPVEAGWTLVIYRDTPKNSPLVDFSDNSIVNERNLDTNFQQAIFSVAEMLDRFDDTVQFTLDAYTAAENARVSAANALASEQAAAGSSASAAASAATAAAAAGSAAVSQAAAAASEAQSATNAVAAATGAATASAAASSAGASATLATNKAAAAAGSAAAADASALLAQNTGGTAWLPAGLLAPVVFTSGIAATVATSVIYAGVVYAARPDAVPFTTTGTFNPTQWNRVYGVSADQLARLGTTAADLIVTSFSAVGVADGAWVHFAGRDAVGDGGGGWFRYSATSTQPADGGTVFAVSGGGRVFREGWTVFNFNGTLLAPWFSTKGDGSDETVKFQSAVTAMRAGDTLSGAGRTYTVKRIKLKSLTTLRDTNFVTLAGAVPSEYWSPVTIGDNGDMTTYTDITCINVKVNGNRANNNTGSVAFAEDGGKHGFRVIGNVKRIKFIECSAQYCGSYGFFFYRGLNTATIPFGDIPTIDDVQLIDCVSQYNKAHGGAADSITNFVISGGRYTHNGLAYLSDPGGLTLGGAAYGNAWDFEGYGIGSWIGNIYIHGADLRHNAAASLLFTDPANAVDDARFAIRDTIVIQDVQADTGSDPSRTNPYAAVIITPPYANWTKGSVYKNVSIIGGNIIGEINFACVDDMRIDVEQYTTRSKLGDGAYSNRVTCNTPSPYRFTDLFGADVAYLYAQPENLYAPTDAHGLPVFSSKAKYGLDMQLCYSDVVSFAAGEEKVVTAALPRAFDNRQLGAFGFVSFVSESGEVYVPRSASGTSATVQALVKNGSSAQSIRLGFVVFGE